MKTAHQKIFPFCDSRLLTKMISRLSKEESLLPHSNNHLFSNFVSLLLGVGWGAALGFIFFFACLTI
jgi:hypothetical protein